MPFFRLVNAGTVPGPAPAPAVRAAGSRRGQIVITDFHASRPDPRPGDTLFFEGWLMESLGGGRCLPILGKCIDICTGWVDRGKCDDIAWTGCPGTGKQPPQYFPQGMITDAKGRFYSSTVVWPPPQPPCVLVQALFLDPARQTIIASSPLMRVGQFGTTPECPPPGPSLPVSLCARLGVQPQPPF